MSLKPNRNVFITCAVTGAGDTTGRSAKVPVTPRQIADSCIEAATAGAAVVHIHVRDPDTGAPARDPALYAEVVEHIRTSGVDMVLNLTAGMGGDLTLGSVEQPLPPATEGTDMAGATERLAHVAHILPEICTLDCGTMNFGEGDYIMTNSPAMLKEMARQIQALGVRPEIEAFDTGHILLAKWLQNQGLIDNPAMIQLCMGIPWGAPDDFPTFMAMINAVPQDWTFSAFSIGRNQLPYVAMAVNAGGNVRVGLEDNIWLDKGVLASNGDLVARARTIIEAMGSQVLSAQQVREQLKLVKRWG
ncbi:MAG: 3-keto-5-aminohexanoate cleavage protein [Thiolinea sp.]